MYRQVVRPSTLTISSEWRCGDKLGYDYLHGQEAKAHSARLLWWIKPRRSRRVAVPVHQNITRTEEQNVLRYQDPAFEIKRIHGASKVTVITIVIGAPRRKQRLGMGSQICPTSLEVYSCRPSSELLTCCGKCVLGEGGAFTRKLHSSFHFFACSRQNARQQDQQSKKVSHSLQGFTSLGKSYGQYCRN